MRLYRLALLLLAIGWIILTAILFTRAIDDGAPFLTVRFASVAGMLWLLIGAALPLAIALSGIRAGRARARRIERAAALIEGTAIVDRRGRVLWHNAAAARMIERERLSAPVAGLVDRALRGGRTMTQTLTVRDGVHFAIQAQPIDQHSAVVTSRPVIGTEGQAAFYDNFIRRIVHDMRNPLAGIIGHAANLSGAETIDADSWRASARIIETEANRLTRLVDSMLFDARLSYVPPQWTRVDLIDLLEDAVYRQDERAIREGKALSIDAPNAAMPIEADRDLLLRAFQNLIDNGLKYSGAGGTVRIVLQFHDDGCQVRVEDDGIGIPPEYLPDRIFEPMVRVSGDGGGTGLGLSIVRKIVELHGGTIHADSRVGVGTTMIVDLPGMRTK